MLIYTKYTMPIFPILHLSIDGYILHPNIDFIKIIVKSRGNLICSKEMCTMLPTMDSRIYSFSENEPRHNIEYGKNIITFEKTFNDIFFGEKINFKKEEEYYIIADDIPQVFTDPIISSMIEKVFLRLCYPEKDSPFIEHFTSNKKYEYPIFKHWKIESIIHNSRNKPCKCLLMTKGEGEVGYISILESVLENGQRVNTRNSETLSEFGKTLTFDLCEGFPLLTSKKMFFRGIVEEFLFFIRGETDSKILEEKGINIWKLNTSKEFLSRNNLPYREGLMGPMYGYLWRYYGAKYRKDGTPDKDTEYIDQLKYVIDCIINDPHSRRILLTSYNPSDAHKSVLFPCHSVIMQFYVRYDLYLDMYVYIRSSDLFLGLPFNIASSSLLLFCISRITKKVPGKLIIQLGDAHIYSSHISAVKEQISRYPHYKFPKLEISKIIDSIKDLESLEYNDFILNDYMHYPAIKADMIA